MAIKARVRPICKGTSGERRNTSCCSNLTVITQAKKLETSCQSASLTGTITACSYLSGCMQLCSPWSTASALGEPTAASSWWSVLAWVPEGRAKSSTAAW
eukprot:CAMPEP_0172818790 /NCGR_PEP_ID=MMETSP1075-20121228/14140_1 /TAXON_ID=2916 /ORGANISM="Ceratium fusus, Strain PA161109" /LENGTH=99 /DNA_ID=CAMNT_0013659199 /DNA_START=383 /DNA_END=683 /DNA_ORIENTATION=+